MEPEPLLTQGCVDEGKGQRDEFWFCCLAKIQPPNRHVPASACEKPVYSQEKMDKTDEQLQDLKKSSSLL